MRISPGLRGRMEAKPTRAASIKPIYVRLPLWVNRLDTDAINRQIARGLLRSDKIVRHLSDIPCDIIQTLENDAGEAKTFIDELEHRKVPTIIQHLPDEVIGVFSEIVGIFGTLPTQILNEAEAAVTDAVHIFNDIGSGAITSDLEQIPGIIVSDITNAWGDLTSGLEDDWKAAKAAFNTVACFIHHNCPAPATTGGSCGSTQATTAPPSSQSSLPTRSSAISPTPPAISSIPGPTQILPKPSNASLTFGNSSSPSSAAINVASGLKLDSTIFRLNIFQLCWILGSGLLGVMFLL